MAVPVFIDMGWFKIQTNLKALHNRNVDVGVLPGAGSQGGVRIADYATFNEFGTAVIPARPFMRKTADDSRQTLPVFTNTLINNLISGNTTPLRVQHALGAWYRTRIRMTIQNAPSWAAPNAPSTVAAKGHSSPLLETYALFNSINYKLS